MKKINKAEIQEIVKRVLNEKLDDRQSHRLRNLFHTILNLSNDFKDDKEVYSNLMKAAKFIRKIIL